MFREIYRRKWRLSEISKIPLTFEYLPELPSSVQEMIVTVVVGMIEMVGCVYLSEFPGQFYLFIYLFYFSSLPLASWGGVGNLHCEIPLLSRVTRQQWWGRLEFLSALPSSSSFWGFPLPLLFPLLTRVPLPRSRLILKKPSSCLSLSLAWPFPYWQTTDR